MFTCFILFFSIQWCWKVEVSTYQTVFRFSIALLRESIKLTPKFQTKLVIVISTYRNLLLVVKSRLIKCTCRTWFRILLTFQTVIIMIHDQTATVILTFFSCRFFLFNKKVLRTHLYTKYWISSSYTRFGWIIKVLANIIFNFAISR